MLLQVWVLLSVNFEGVAIKQCHQQGLGIVSIMV